MAPMKAPANREPLAELDDTVSLTHLAHRWGVSRRRIRQLLQSGGLPFVEIAGQLRVSSKVVVEVETGRRSVV
ncbi:MAG: hypothetical protein AAGD11_19430 [Planctomycetota bacterium]